MEEDKFEKIMTSILQGIIVAFPISTFLIVGPIANCAQSKTIEESYQHLSEQTSETFNIEDFKAYEGTIELEDGSQYKLFMSGSSKDKFVKLSANISIEDAYEIISLNKQFENLGISSDGIYYNKFDQDLKRPNNEATEIYCDLISAFATAVKNSYNQKQEIAIDEELLNGSIETNSLASVKDLQVLNLSNVEQNNENLYYFYIDVLLETKEGQISRKKLKVEVEGRDLSQNEVYAKYLSGDYKSIRVENNPENGVSESEIGLTK